MATKKAPESAPPSAPPPTSHRFFTWMRSLDIQREPGWIGGVASGLATRIGIDPVIVRGIIVVVAILAGPALLVYAAAWLLLPDLDDRIHLEQALKGEASPALAGIGVLVLFSFLPIAPGLWFAGYGFWEVPFWDGNIWRAFGTLALLALAVWFVVWLARRPSLIQPPTNTNAVPAPKAPPINAPAEDFAVWREQQAAWKAENLAFRQQQNSERAAAWRAEYEAQRAEVARARAEYRAQRRRTRGNPLFTLLVVGLALVAGGFTTLWLTDGEFEVTTAVAGLSVALAVLALGMIVNGLLGKRPGGAAGFAALAVVPLLLFTVFPQSDHFQYANGAYFAPKDQPDGIGDLFIAGGGRVHMALQHYYVDDLPADDDGWGTDHVYLFVLSGEVTIDLPEDRYSSVDATVVSGGVEVRDGDGENTWQGRSPNLMFNQTNHGDEEPLTVHIFLLRGTITINDPEAN